MQNTFFIDKKKLSESENEYDRFFRQGIEMLQKYCGDVWTDYNLHDPGVTILEQLCYALTELYYKSTFPIEDYLSDKDNRIPFEYLGLLRSENIIPNGCVTINDFRKVLFDEVDEAGNVWLENDHSDCPGLYKIFVDIADHITITEAIKKEITENIRRSFVKRRNLNEDISEIIILEREYCDLCGEIEIRTRRPIDEVYGDIYAACMKYVSSNMIYRSVKDLQLQGKSLPEILNGPLLKNGIIIDSDLNDRLRIISISELSAEIQKIEGVIQIDSLFLKCNNKDIYGETPYCEGNKVKSIKIPEINDHILLRLKSSGRFFTADSNNISNETLKHLRCDSLYPDFLNDIRTVFPFPEGSYKEFNNYFSIQNHFPANYGISYEGLPESVSNERKAKAKQLKAYLYFFEQIMADYLESVQNIKTILSPDTQLQKTYYSKYLDDKDIPGIEDLYINDLDATSKIKKVLDYYDDYITRRSEILDFLLSIYGLEFRQVSLRHYLNGDKTGKVSQNIINNKIRYLNYASLITLRNSKGIDYLAEESSSSSMSGLELQTILRTGNDPDKKDKDEKMLVIEHILLRPSTKKLGDKARWFYQFRTTAVFSGHKGRYWNRKFRKLVMEIIEKYAPPHIFVDFIWCDEAQWNRIYPVYKDWLHSLSQENDSRDRKSLALSRLIVEFSKSEKNNKTGSTT